MNHRSVAFLVAAIVTQPIAAQSTPFDQAKEHLAKARELAGLEFVKTEEVQCHELGGTDPYRSTEKAKDVKPTAVFDNLFYVGTTLSGAWALKTSAGIILINSLHTEELKSTLLPGMKKVGLDPAQVKYVIVTQARGSEYGGARYFQDAYGAQVIMSAADWDAVSRLAVRSERPAARSDSANGNGHGGSGGGSGGGGRGGSGGGRGGFGGGRGGFGGGRGGGGFGGGRESTTRNRPPTESIDEAPRHDQIAVDSGTITLGDETVTIVRTPGTTPGALTVLVPVVDRGASHVAAIVGTTEIPTEIDAKKAYIASATHLGEVAAAHHVDAELLSYPFVDNTVARMDTVRRTESKGAALSVKNPFVIGEAGFQRFIGVIGECGQVELLYPFRRVE